jgi:long-chain fatty acid transport protein
MRKLSGLIAVTCLAWTSPAFATNGMRMIGFGAVQDSMGGVGVGATLDACSLLSNPAGIADLGQRLDVGMSWFSPTVSYGATGAVSAPGATLDSTRGGSPIPALGYVRPISEALSVGVGLFGVAGMGVDYAANLYNSNTLTSYLQARLTPGAAYKVTDKLSVGVTANVMMAQMKYDVAGAMGQVKHDTANSFGIGATLGVKYSPVKMLTLGAAYETKSSFQSFEFDVPAHNVTVPDGSGGFMSVPVPGGTDKLDFDQPQSVTFGASVRPIEMLVLAADVSWINWSDTMGDQLPKYTNNTNTTGAMPFNMGWDDQWVVKFGAQVTPMKSLDLRAGYNYGKMPLDPNRAFENMAFPAVSEHHFTAGAGYQVTDKLGLSLAAMYSPEAKVSGANADQFIPAYTTKMSQFQIDGGATYRF